MVKNLPANAGDVRHAGSIPGSQVQSPGQEDPRRRAQQPTPVLLPRESHAQRSLAGYSPQAHKESDMTEATEHVPKMVPGMWKMLHKYLWDE